MFVRPAGSAAGSGSQQIRGEVGQGEGGESHYRLLENAQYPP